MGPLPKGIEASINERLNSRLKQHRLAHVAPPVISRKLTGLYRAAADRREHWNAGLGRYEAAKAGAQLFFEGVHLAAVKGIIDLQQLAGHLAAALRQGAQEPFDLLPWSRDGHELWRVDRGDLQVQSVFFDRCRASCAAIAIAAMAPCIRARS